MLHFKRTLNTAISWVSVLKKRKKKRKWGCKKLQTFFMFTTWSRITERLLKGLACNSTFKPNSSLPLFFLITFGGCTSSMCESAQRSIFLQQQKTTKFHENLASRLRLFWTLKPCGVYPIYCCVWLTDSSVWLCVNCDHLCSKKLTAVNDFSEGRIMSTDVWCQQQ